jgi:nicotinamide-nucleotide amidase
VEDSNCRPLKRVVGSDNLKTSIMSDLTLEQRVADLLLSAKMTIAVAESCTGGLICHRLTNISGSSDYFEMGVITYSNRSKIKVLGVSKDIIETQGAVSGACVEAMGIGVKEKAHTTLGFAVSGIAGPTGGTVEKPVGTVYMALAGHENTQTWRFQFKGSRQEIKAQASEEALARIRDYLMAHGLS